MATTILRSRVGNRWSILKNLDRNAKIDLITMLTQSLRDTSVPEYPSASKYYGVWGDDGMTADEFIDAIRAERRFKQDVIEL